MKVYLDEGVQKLAPKQKPKLKPLAESLAISVVSGTAVCLLIGSMASIVFCEIPIWTGILATFAMVVFLSSTIAFAYELAADLCGKSKFDDSKSVFDTNTLFIGNVYETMCGLNVKIDRVLYDITKNTLIGVGGTLYLNEYEFHGVWDISGKVLNMPSHRELLDSFSRRKSDSALIGYTESMLRLVCVVKQIMP